MVARARCGAILAVLEVLDSISLRVDKACYADASSLEILCLNWSMKLWTGLNQISKNEHWNGTRCEEQGAEFSLSEAESFWMI